MSDFLAGDLGELQFGRKLRPVCGELCMSCVNNMIGMNLLRDFFLFNISYSSAYLSFRT